MAQLASWVSGAADEFSFFLLVARLASLLLLVLLFLGGAEERGAGEELRIAMADTSFSLLFLGTSRKLERTGLLEWGTLGALTLGVFREALGMGSRGFLGIGSLEFTFTLFLGTVFKFQTARLGGSWITDPVEMALVEW